MTGTPASSPYGPERPPLRLLRGQLPDDYLRGTGPVSVGIDLAQRFDYSAVAITRAHWPGPPSPLIFELVALERLPQGTAYGTQVGHFARRIRLAQSRMSEPGRVNVDVTGVGRPVAELLTAQVDGSAWRVNFVTIGPGDRIEPGGYLPGAGPREVRDQVLNGGHPPPSRYAESLRTVLGADVERRTAEPHERSAGKLPLVSRLQAVIAAGRLWAPELSASPNLKLFAEELDAFEGRIGESGRMKAEAAAGMHDDLVTAVALAVLDEPVRLPPAARPANMRTRPKLPPGPIERARIEAQRREAAREQVNALGRALRPGGHSASVGRMSDADVGAYWQSRNGGRNPKGNR